MPPIFGVADLASVNPFARRRFLFGLVLAVHALGSYLLTLRGVKLLLYGRSPG
jgi:hypothetical protein